jgi:hypothetical protein
VAVPLLVPAIVLMRRRTSTVLLVHSASNVTSPSGKVRV